MSVIETLFGAAALSHLAAYFPETGSVKRDVPAAQTGVLNSPRGVVPADVVFSVKCQIAPLSADEMAQSTGSAYASTHRITLRGFFPQANAGCYFVAADGTRYNVKGARADATKTLTVLDCELVKR